MPAPAPTPSRALLKLSGPDAAALLQRLVTQNIDALDDGARLSALLTPQGKIAFEFFLIRDADALLIDAPSGDIERLKKMLTMYRLRADVTIEEDARQTAALTPAQADALGAAALADGQLLAKCAPAVLGARLIAPAPRR